METLRLLIIFLVFLSVNAQAATYYINGDTVSSYVGTQGTYAPGSDAQDGLSLGSPKATIQAAMAAAGAGDHTFYVAESAYTGRLLFTTAGSQSLIADGDVSVTSTAEECVRLLALATNISITGMKLSSVGHIILQTGYVGNVLTVTNCDLIGAGTLLGNMIRGRMSIIDCTVSGAITSNAFSCGASTLSEETLEINGLFGGVQITGLSLVRNNGSASVTINGIGQPDAYFAITGIPSYVFSHSTPANTFSLSNMYLTMGCAYANNPFTFNASCSVDMSDVYIIATADYAVTGSSHSAIIMAINNISPIFDNIHISSYGASAKTHLLVYGNAAGDYGTPTLTNSSFYTESTEAYCVAFGWDHVTSVSDCMQPIIKNNTITLNPGAKSILHTLFVRAQLEPIIIGNTIIGHANAKYGILIKGFGEQQSWTANGICALNYVNNLSEAIRLKDMRGVRVINNTVLNGRILIANDSYDSINFECIANIVQNDIDLACITIPVGGATGLSLTHNSFSASGSVAVIDGTTYATRVDLNAAYPGNLNTAPDTVDGVLPSASGLIKAGVTAHAVSISGKNKDFRGNEYFFTPYDRLNIGADQAGSDADKRTGTAGLSVYFWE